MEVINSPPNRRGRLGGCISRFPKLKLKILNQKFQIKKFQKIFKIFFSTPIRIFIFAFQRLVICY